MPIVYALIEYEFEQNVNSPTTVFRNNTLSTKFIGIYMRRIGLQYLKVVLSSFIQDVSAADDSLSFELDPRRLPEGEDLSKNQSNLILYVRRIVSTITSDVAIDSMPHEMRMIAKWIADFAASYGWRHEPLVGGFVFLRLFNPAIVSPETFDLATGNDVSAHARRNLVMVSKVVQNLANGLIEFKKEPYMECMNSVLEELNPSVQLYLNHLVQRPQRIIGPVEPPFETADDIDLRMFDIKDLLIVHSTLVQYADKLIAILQRESLRDDHTGSSAIASDREFLDLIKQLGPAHRKASDVLIEKAEKDSALDSALNASHPEDDDDESTPLEQLRESSYAHLMKLDVDLSRLESTKAMYQGAPTKSGVAMFYLIMSRLGACADDILTDLNLLAMYVIRTLGDAVNLPFNVVVDFSWNQIPLHKQLFRSLLGFSRLFAKKHKKNLQAIYLVHPVAFSYAISWLVRNFPGSKTRKKMFEIYDWRELRSVVDLDSISLPDESKHCIARSYRCLKVNAKGKKQNRLVKLTPISILNIDPKTQCIKNERLLSEIQEVVEGEDGSLRIHFNLLAEPEPEIGFFPCINSTSEDMATRVYLMQNSAERQELMDDIMDAAFHADKLQHPQAFLYRKTSAKKQGVEVRFVAPLPPPGQRYTSALGDVPSSSTSGPVVSDVTWEISKNERILKITVDSILLIEKSTIRMEVHFCAIESIFQDAADPFVVWLKFTGEDTSRRLVCPQGREMVGAVQAAISNFRARKLRIEEDAEFDRLAFSHTEYV
jgi:hypothetical protein